MITDPAKGYTPEQRAHVEMLRKRRAQLDRQESERKRKGDKKK